MKELFIDKGLLERNYSVVRQKLENAQVMAVLKNNAYGLGLLPMARFWKEMGVRRFGVGDPADAALLRSEGFTHEEILLMRPTAVPAEIDLLLDNGVIATIGSQESALALSGIAEKRSTVAEAHLKIDCGLGRYGFLPRELDKVQNIFSYMQNIAVSGVYTHLPNGISLKKARLCLDSFDAMLTALREKSIETGTVHALGSTALFHYDTLPQYDMVRIGAAMTGRISGKTGLTPVGAVIAPITDVRWIPPGTAVAGKLRFRHPVRVGFMPVGYANGFLVDKPAYSRLFEIRRGKIGYGKVTVRLDNGETVHVIGLVGQNHMVVDLTKSNASVGTIGQVNVNPLFASSIPRVLQ